MRICPQSNNQKFEVKLNNLITESNNPSSSDLKWETVGVHYRQCIYQRRLLRTFAKRNNIIVIQTLYINNIAELSRNNINKIESASSHWKSWLNAKMYTNHTNPIHINHVELKERTTNVNNNKVCNPTKVEIYLETPEISLQHTKNPFFHGWHVADTSIRVWKIFGVLPIRVSVANGDQRGLYFERY